MDNIKKAKLFAIAAHNSINQKRKYTNKPYWIHPVRVSEMVSKHTKDESVIIAALLHDVLEDVATINPFFGEKNIKATFGERVLKLVLEMTDISKPSDGNRKTRKDIDRAHTSCASKEGKLIKLADLIDNIKDIDKYDKKFSVVFRREAILLLPILKEGNHILYKELCNHILSS